jgi:hypothetical protein
MLTTCEQIVSWERYKNNGPMIIKKMQEHYDSCNKCESRKTMWKVVIYKMIFNNLGSGQCIFIGREDDARICFERHKTVNGKVILINNQNDVIDET